MTAAKPMDMAGIPERFLDPITAELMTDPVICNGGLRYDRTTAQRLQADPFTRAPFHIEGDDFELRREIVSRYPCHTQQPHASTTVAALTPPLPMHRASNAPAGDWRKNLPTLVQAFDTNHQRLAEVAEVLAAPVESGDVLADSADKWRRQLRDFLSLHRSYKKETFLWQKEMQKSERLVSQWLAMRNKALEQGRLMFLKRTIIERVKEEYTLRLLRSLHASLRTNIEVLHQIVHILQARLRPQLKWFESWFPRYRCCGGLKKS